jgi:competence protein ComEA
MDILDRHYRLALMALIVIILAGAGFWMLKRSNPALFLGEPDYVVGESEGNSPSNAPTAAQKQPEIIVHVAGAVKSPGVYHLAHGERLQDAIEAAGGATQDADIHRLNLAMRVQDGQRVYVPGGSESAPPSVPAPSITDAAQLAEASPSPLASDALIDLNTATSEQLQTLPRIGPVMAQRIIEYRQTHGGFTSVEDLMNVKGIGEKTFEKIRPLVVVY